MLGVTRVFEVPVVACDKECVARRIERFEDAAQKLIELREKFVGGQVHPAVPDLVGQEVLE